MGVQDALRLNLVRLDHAVQEIETDKPFHRRVTEEYSDLFDDKLESIPFIYKMTVD